MSNPFPVEEEGQLTATRPTWNPWEGPAKPHWYSGMEFNENTAYLGPAYRLLESMASEANKGAAVLSGALHDVVAPIADVTEKYGQVGATAVRGVERYLADVQTNARQTVKELTPDPTTTGFATQLLHNVVGPAYLMMSGAPLGGALAAASTVGVTEGASRYQELAEKGVGPLTAAAEGTVSGVASGAGALIPAAYGSSLLGRLVTGAASNSAFGVASRAADHLILQAGGYPEMAQQQKVWDGSQMLVDAALGATFGLISHAQSRAEERAQAALRNPANEDAALTANLALRDRAAAPGVPADPEAAGAHQAALEKATEDLLQGKPVDIAGTGVDRATFVERPARDLSPEGEIMLKSFKESGLMEEEANLRDLEAALAKRMGTEPPEVPAAPRRAAPSSEGAKEEVRPNEPMTEGVKAPSEESLTGVSPPLDIVAQALQERPDLEIPNEDGVVMKATDALAAAEDKTDYDSAFKAATDCFMRRGG